MIGGKSVYLEDKEFAQHAPICSNPLVPLVQLNASSDATPEAFRGLVPPPANGLSDEDTVVTLLQLFIRR